MVGTQCPAGTLKCPDPPAPAGQTPCQKDYTLCATLGPGAYCGSSGDPDAYDNVTGCSCGWDSHFSASTGKCASGTCNGNCHTDASRPCLGLNANVCFPLLSNNDCPPGTKDCRFNMTTSPDRAGNDLAPGA